MNFRVHSVSWLALLVILRIAAAQAPRQAPKKRPPDQFTLISIEVAGNKHYSREQITSVTGLRVGQSVSDDGMTVSEDIFRRAADRVGNTGAFSDVTYQYEFSAKGTRFSLRVRESERFLAARFDNFVWFSDDELIAALKQQVPFFDGTVPVSGTIADQIAQALQAMLTERNLPGTVEHIDTSQSSGGPIEAVTYTVSGVPIRIASIDFPGALPSELAPLEAAAEPLRDQEYSRSMLQAQDKFNLLPIYLSRGYLKAEFQDPSCKVLPQSNSDKTLVDVIIPVSPGLQYKVANIQWTGNSVFPRERLQSFIHLRAGEAANAVKLREDIDAIKELYGTRGYLAAQVISTAQFDDASSAVSYVLALREGDIYRMGTFEIQGLDTETIRTMSGVWKLHRGEPYDDSYLKQQFFGDVAKVRIAIPSDLAVSVEQKLNRDDKTVSVTLRFAPKKSS